MTQANRAIQQQKELWQLESPAPSSRGNYQIITVKQPPSIMAQDVLEGLEKEPPGIPCAYLYDEAGSRLFEKITVLPEYYPTRTEAAILKAIAPNLRQTVGQVEIIELGSGSSTKTRILLDAWQAQRQPLTYVPIDISYSMLSAAAGQLAYEYKGLRVLGLCGEYKAALATLSPNANRLILFLGGTMGNFTLEEQQAFFSMLRQYVTVGNKLLIGFDLKPHAGKPLEIIRKAYNDSAGVTAHFNLNVLNHINHRLNADFCLENWRHQAIFNEEAHQIEMYLVSQAPQHVTVLGQTFHFDEGRRILTEISRRFEPDELARWFETLSFQCLQFWSDAGRYFGLMLLEAV